MAEGQEDRSSEDLGEEISPYKLEEYRRKGQVAQSRELTGLVALLAVAVTAYALSPKMGAQMAEFMREVFRTDLSSRSDLSNHEALGALLMKAIKILAAVGLPVCLAGFGLGAAGSFAQIGSIFTFEPLQPDMSKIDPLSGMQRLVSLKHLKDMAVMLLKFIVLFAVAYGLIKTEILQAPAHILTEPIGLLSSYGHTAKVIFFPLFGVLGVFAAVDLVMQRRDYNNKLRMTKQEAKQEYKEREGDPQIKARIRGAQREIARKRMMHAVRKADVIITNPTHFAIAIVYDKEKMAAPRVVAKGADFLAQKIKQVAAEAGVPLVENVPLARTLYKTVKVGQVVPRALYQAVAEVLAYVYRLKNRGL